MQNRLPITVDFANNKNNNAEVLDDATRNASYQTIRILSRKCPYEALLASRILTFNIGVIWLRCFADRSSKQVRLWRSVCANSIFFGSPWRMKTHSALPGELYIVLIALFPPQVADSLLRIFRLGRGRVGLARCYGAGARVHCVWLLHRRQPALVKGRYQMARDIAGQKERRI